MDEEQKISEKELEDLKELNSKYSSLLMDIGECMIYLEELRQKVKKAEEDRNTLLNDYQTIKNKSEEFTKTLIDKYGQGRISLETGKIELI
jgi:hypothetical protein